MYMAGKRGGLNELKKTNKQINPHKLQIVVNTTHLLVGDLFFDKSYLMQL